MPGSGFSKFQNNKENRQQIENNIANEGQIAFNRQGSFSTYYGVPSFMELSRAGHRVSDFSFSRDAGVDLCRLYLLLNSDLSVEEIFLDQQAGAGETMRDIRRNDHILEEKREAGNAVLEILDHNTPERASKLIADMLADAIPKMVEAMDDYAGDPYKNVLEERSGKQIIAGRIATTMFDMLQEYTITTVRKAALQNAFDDYNRRKPEDAERLNTEKFLDIASSMTDEYYHAHYRDRVQDYADAQDPVQKESTLLQVLLAAGVMKYREDLRTKNLANGREKEYAITYMEANPIEKIKEEVNDLYTFRMKPALLSVYSWEDLEHAIYTGEFYDSAKFELNEDGTLKSVSCMGLSYDCRRNLMTMPDSKLSKMENRNKNYMDIVRMETAIKPTESSSGENFLALTGFTKNEFFKGTFQFGLNFSRQTAQGFLISKLVGDGMSLEDALDPNKFLDIKHAEAAKLREMLKLPVPEAGTPEYQKRFEDLVRYGSLAYWKAEKVYEEVIRKATEDDKLVTSPSRLFSTPEGRKAAAVCAMVHDLSQELTKAKTEGILNSVSKLERPTVSEKLANLGAATYCIKGIAKLPKEGKDLLATDGKNIADIIKQQVDIKAHIDDMKEREAAFRRENPGKEPDYRQLCTLQDIALVNASELDPTVTNMLNALKIQIANRFTIDDISRKSINGEMLKSIRIEKEDGMFKSISVLGMKVDRKLNVTNEQGGPLPDEMTDATKGMYKRHIQSLIKAANDTDELLVFNNTQNFTDFITNMNKMKSLLKQEHLDYASITRALEPVMENIRGYREAHKTGELNSFQKRRLKAMDQVEEFYEAVKIRERDLDTPENVSIPLRNIRTARYAAEQNVISAEYEKNDGREVLDRMTLDAHNRIYNIILNKTEVTKEMQKDLITDLKVIALSNVLRSEKTWVSADGGAITNVVKKNPDNLKDIIKNADIGPLAKFEAFKNPTTENVTALFKEDKIRTEVDSVIKVLGDKVQAERERIRREASKEKAAQEKAAQGKAAEKKDNPAQVRK